MLKRMAKKILFTTLDDRAATYLSHFSVHRRLPDLHDQRSFSDRMAFRRLHPRPEFEHLTDKIRVRDFVKARIGEQYLIPLIAVASDVDQIRFENLPSSFVMKASHGCGWNELVWDKATADMDLLRAKARSWLSQNFYEFNRERHYRDIIPRIMFEQLLRDGNNVPHDYKIHCFRKQGRLTQIVQIHTDRFGDHRVNFYTADWNPIELSHGYPRLPCDRLRQPDSWTDMLRIAEILSSGFNYVRIDLYSMNGRSYFGEMTFTPGAGLLRFDPVEVDGQWAELFERDPSGSDVPRGRLSLGGQSPSNP